AGEVLDLLHLHAFLGEHGGSAARRQDLDPQPGEAAGEVQQARLVRDADQRACNSHDAAPYHSTAGFSPRNAGRRPAADWLVGAGWIAAIAVRRADPAAARPASERASSSSSSL